MNAHSNQLSLKLETFLRHFRDEFEPVTKGDLNKIANDNMWKLELDANELQQTGADTVALVLEKAKRLTSRKWQGSGHVFYCWFDEMAGHLCLSCIPSGSRLPFTCELNKVANLKVIVEKAVETGATGFIEMAEFEETDFDSTFEEDAFVLDVYYKEVSELR